MAGRGWVWSEAVLITAIDEAVTAADPVRLGACAFQAEQQLLVAGGLSDPLFAAWLQQLGRPQWRSMSDAFYLLRPLEGNLDLLETAQRRELMAALEAAYAELLDSTACCLAVELIAELYADDRSLDSLRRLKGVSSEGPRALVAHGLRTLSEKARAPAVADACRKELQAMLRDTSDIVQQEAKQALAQLRGADGK